MDTYWSYTEKRRSEMSHEEVEALLKYELMEAGIVKLEEPQYLPEDVVKPASKKLYFVRHRYSSVNGYAYLSPQDAQEAMQKAQVLDYEYIGGEHYHTIAKSGEAEIATVEVYNREDLLKMKSQIEKCKEAVNYNSQIRKEYEQNLEAIAGACEGVWLDYHQQKIAAQRNRKIIETYEDYLKMCDGDTLVAVKFLRKAYDDEKIMEAFEWFDLKVPSVMVVEQGA